MGKCALPRWACRRRKLCCRVLVALLLLDLGLLVCLSATLIRHRCCPERPYIRKSTVDVSEKEWEALKAAWHQLNDEFLLGDLFNQHRLYAQHSMHSTDNVAVPIRAPNGGNLLFLPWHRRFVANLEDLLHSRQPGLVLPYWDIPNHPAVPSQLVDFLPAVRFGGGDTPSFQPTRAVGQDVGPPELDQLHFALSRRLYSNFSLDLECVAFHDSVVLNPGYHDRGHGYVGGTMANLATANADILFYLHHAFVDKAWSEWQLTQDTAIVDSAPTSSSLVPFHATVGSVQDIGTMQHPYRYV